MPATTVSSPASDSGPTPGRAFPFWLWAGNAAAILIIAALCVYLVLSSRDAEHEQARVRSQNMALLLEQSVRQLVDKSDLVLQTVAREAAQHAQSGQATAPALARLIAGQAALLPEINGIRLADADGRVVLGGGAQADFRGSIADRDFFVRASAGEHGLLFSGPHQSRANQEWVLLLARRISHPVDGHFLGTVSVGIPVDRLRALFSGLQLGPGGSAVLRDASHRVVARYAPSETQPTTGSDKAPAQYVEHLKSNPETATYVSVGAFDGIQRLVTYRRIGHYPLYALIGLSTDDYLAGWRSNALLAATLSALAALLLLATSAALHRLWCRQTDAASRLRESEESRTQAHALLQEAVDSIAVGIALYDRDDRLVTCNQAYRDLYPLTAPAIRPGKSFEDILRAGVAAGQYPQAMGDEEGFIRERMAWHAAANGTPVEHVIGDGRQMVHVEHRTPSGHIVCNRIDITELHRYRTGLEELVATRTAALEEATRQFRVTFDQAAVGICHVGLDYHWLRINRRMCDILGYSPEELQDKTFVHITHPDDIDLDLAQARQLLNGDISHYSMEKRYLRPDGSAVWGNLTVALVRDAQGRPDYFISVVEDISRRKAAEQALAEERDSQRLRLEREVAARTADLQAANRELQSFTYAASHDLRSPLGRINSFGTLLEQQYRDRLDGDGLLFLNMIRRNTLRMIALIDDLLAHAQIEQKIMEHEPVGLRAAIAAVLSERDGELREGGVEVRTDVPDVTLRANTHGFAQVLRNLVENAIKYSSRQERPRIDIGAKAAGGTCHVWVRDNGVGFDMAHHERIFEIFRRLHTYDEFPGSGVGLALVRKAMERMGGRVWAESAPGHGAIFHLELPLEREAAPA